MKKLVSLLLVLVLMASIMSFAIAETYSATEKGFAGDVTVTLDIADGKIVSADIVGASETENIGGVAIEKLSAAMVEKNSVELDAIAGATFTSNAILTAAAKAVTEAGVTLEPVAQAEAAAQAKEPEFTDVLVIGGGAAGLSAASTAAEKGAKVILLEKLPFTGGNMALSGGVFTRAKMEGDAEDDMDADELYDFLMSQSEDLASPEILKTFIEKGTETFTWLYDNVIGTYEGTSRYPMVPPTVVSVAAPGTGAGLAKSMADYAAKMGIDIRLETSAEKLIEKDGKVVGVVARCADGSTQEFYANGGVILATGGFASSPEMLAKYSTSGAEKVSSYASAGTVGDGLTMAEAVGASINFHDEWDTCGGPDISFTMLTHGVDFATLYPMVLINDRGERFLNEFCGLPALYTSMRQQIATGVDHFWFITNDELFDNTDWLCEYAEGFKAETLEEIAEKLSISPKTLKQTMDSYNACAGTDNDTLGKPAQYNKGMNGPFTVFPVAPLRTNTLGGLSITTEAEVMDEAGNAIPGLYAAGEVANYNFYGRIYNCGTAIGHAITFGRIAGTNAAENIQ